LFRWHIGWWLNKHQILIYRIINTLSIDISLGAVVVAYFFCLVFDISPDRVILLILGLSVWMIYTIDHLLDAKKITNKAATFRHHFHQQYFSQLVWSTIVLGMTTAVLVVYYLDLKLIYAGALVAVLSIVYLLSQRYLSFLKESIGAILYTVGVLVPVAAQATFSLSNGKVSLVMQFFLVVLMNLILFSHFDKSKDEFHGQHSIATSFGVHTTNRLVWILFLFSTVMGGVNIFIISEFRTAAIIILSMGLLLAIIQLRQQYFANHDRFRYVGDAIFFVPLVYLFLR
jgi:4-hydroxybenzoate polyprenyltransferase